MVGSIRHFSSRDPRVSVTIALLLAAMPLAVAADDADDEDERSEAPELRVPSLQFPTIQQAIDGAADGSAIRVAPGVYQETLLIAGKRLRIRGTSRHGQRTEIRGVNQQAAVISYGAAGGGELSNLVVRGAAFGVSGAPLDQQQFALPAALTLRHVQIAESGRGIFGTFSDIRIRDSHITHTPSNGIVVRAGTFEMVHGRVDNAGGVGILILNDVPGTGYTLDRELLGFNAAGGIEVYGHASPVVITNSVLSGNTVAGITLLNADNTVITDTGMAYSRADDGGKWGDGLRVFSSVKVSVSGSYSSHNERAGVSVFGCMPAGPVNVALADDVFAFNAFFGEIDSTLGCPSMDPGPSPLHDGDGVTCRDASGPIPCVALSASSEPAPVPTP